MAKLQPKWKRELKRIARNTGKGIRMVKQAHDTARRPVSTVVSKGAKHLEKWGSSPSRRGTVRNRTQHFNPKTKRWIKRDTKTGKIIGQKRSKGRYRNIRAK